MIPVADPEVVARGGELRGHKDGGSGEGPCPLSGKMFEL